MNHRILFFCRFPPPYNSGQTIGTEIVFNYLKEEFICEKIDLSFGENIVGLGILRSIMYPFFILSKLLLLARKIWKQDFLYIVPGMSIQGIMRDLISVIIASLAGKRVVFHFRNANVHEVFRSGPRKQILNFYLRRVYRFIFLSDHLLSLNEPTFPKHKCLVIPNSIDDSVILTQEEFEEKKEQQEKKEGVKILYISNLIESKGYLDLIDALGYLLNSGFSHFECDFIGGVERSGDLAILRKKVESNKLTEHVEVHGIISDRDAIKSFYINSDIFVLPTYFPLEAQPRSIIESMNAGNAIISTRHASIPEYVFDGENGFFVEKMNPRDIAEKLQVMISEHRYVEMGKQSRRIFMEKFSSEVIKNQLITVFTDGEN